jgi:hypothetical protein
MSIEPTKIPWHLTPEGKTYHKIYNQTHKRKPRKTYFKLYNQGTKRKTAKKAREQLPEVKAIRKLYVNTRYQTDFLFRKRKQVRCMVRRAFTQIGLKKSSSTLDFMGCSGKKLDQHFSEFLNKPCEEQIACKGTIITIDNSHTDHIVPLKTGKTLAAIKKLSKLRNLRLICIPCNLKKHDKLGWSKQTKRRLLKG